MSCFLSNSSLGKKLVMSVTGCFLVLFILFHMSMNIVAIISPEAYNMICALLGANWYALAGTLVLAAGVVIHFIYAVILTLEQPQGTRFAALRRDGRWNRASTWASKNMLVLGFVILGGLAASPVQLLVLKCSSSKSWAAMRIRWSFGAADGASLIAYTFSQWYYVVIYLVWFFALWFHLTHGVWSMFQTVGWANDTVVSPPEMHRQYRSDDHLPRLCRRRGGLLHQEHLPLLRRRLLTDYPETINTQQIWLLN